MPDLTIRQRSVLRFLQSYREKEGVYATVRDLCREFHWTSPATAHEHLKALERQGFVERKQITRGTFVYVARERWWESPHA